MAFRARPFYQRPNVPTPTPPHTEHTHICRSGFPRHHFHSPFSLSLEHAQPCMHKCQASVLCECVYGSLLRSHSNKEPNPQSADFLGHVLGGGAGSLGALAGCGVRLCLLLDYDYMNLLCVGGREDFMANVRLTVHRPSGLRSGKNKHTDCCAKQLE